MKKLKITLVYLIFTIFFLNFIQAQTIKNYIDNNWQDDRYTDHQDGTVTDTYTGLMWKKCSQGQIYDSTNNTCTATARTYNWKDALQQGESEIFPTIESSYSDWRLPNVEELRSLITLDRINPAININLFPNTKPNYYWSSSPSAAYRSFSWTLSFLFGSDNDFNRNNSGYYVRLVRAGL